MRQAQIFFTAQIFAQWLGVQYSVTLLSWPLGGGIAWLLLRTQVPGADCTRPSTWPSSTCSCYRMSTLITRVRAAVMNCFPSFACMATTDEHAFLRRSPQRACPSEDVSALSVFGLWHFLPFVVVFVFGVKLSLHLALRCWREGMHFYPSLIHHHLC